ncbi:hypothetical protein OSB04_017007 [Centaurea solstitialis]|uniref:Ubiquitin-like protease family profile domain-containing protein n=1 Tax=Centaurea solstitialis TaxID=347529 RepID=A0AA38WAC0_9ASTR|nr:hypothetical protein OSB04_017007 [Centaurea solstitialis]
MQTLIKRPKELQSLYRRWESLSNPEQGVSIQVEPGVFGSQSFEFMIFREDIHCLVNKRWIDHTIIAWFQIFLHGVIQKNEKNRCGFICPSWIHAGECISNKDGVIGKIASVMSDNQRLSFFLAPYLQSAVTRYHENVGPCDTNKLMPFRWEFSKCNQQVSSWECGYYVMHFMFNFVMDQQSQFPNKVSICKYIPWHDMTSLTERMLDGIAVTWAKHFSSAYLKILKT